MKIENPILRGFNPDPSVCRVGADYYLATSTFAYFPAVPIVQATFDPATGQLTSPLQIISENFVGTDIEEPHLYKFNGLYYSSARRAAHGAVTAPWWAGALRPGGRSSRVREIRC